MRSRECGSDCVRRFSPRAITVTEGGKVQIPLQGSADDALIVDSKREKVTMQPLPEKVRQRIGMALTGYFQAQWVNNTWEFPG